MRQALDFNRGAGRQSRTKKLLPRIGMTEKFVYVSGKSAGTHEVVERCPRTFKSELKIHTDLPYLRTHIVFVDNIASFIPSQQSRHEHKCTATPHRYNRRIQQVSADNPLEKRVRMDIIPLHGFPLLFVDIERFGNDLWRARPCVPSHNRRTKGIPRTIPLPHFH